MGCFDTVIVRCPHCKEKTELQTKAGLCELKRYTINNCPPEILPWLTDEPIECEHCGYEYVIRAKFITRAWVEEWEQDDDDDDDDD